MKLQHITFTGIDGKTDLGALWELQEQYPIAEFGVLVAKNWRENGNRYFNPSYLDALESRGASTFDVSGFITSKAAGLRLLRMVRYVLDTDEPKTWLDYREHEPNWIQFKFSAEEFDVEKLDQMAKANDNIITEQIVRQCRRGEHEPRALRGSGTE